MDIVCGFLFVLTAVLAVEKEWSAPVGSVAQAWATDQSNTRSCTGDLGETLTIMAVEVLHFRSARSASVSNYEAAINDLSLAIRLDPHNAALHVERGAMYRALYEWDRALDDFNRAIDLDSSFADAYFQRGLLYYSILQTGVETHDEALADFERYLTLTPDGKYIEQAAAHIDEIDISLEVLREP